MLCICEALGLYPDSYREGKTKCATYERLYYFLFGVRELRLCGGNLKYFVRWEKN
jgi:hypothetical protein